MADLDAIKSELAKAGTACEAVDGAYSRLQRAKTELQDAAEAHDSARRRAEDAEAEYERAQQAARDAIANVAAMGSSDDGRAVSATYTFDVGRTYSQDVAFGCGAMLQDREDVKSVRCELLDEGKYKSWHVLVESDNPTNSHVWFAAAKDFFEANDSPVPFKDRVPGSWSEARPDVTSSPVDTSSPAETSSAVGAAVPES